LQENVIDVDEDDVLIIDGLTKRFRLPGWRVAWIIGPKEFIKASVPLIISSTPPN
jgi:aspartate/methionine/tyrosine aminotransferase